MNGVTGLDDNWASPAFQAIGTLFMRDPQKFKGEHADKAANRFVETQERLRERVVLVAVSFLRNTPHASSAAEGVEILRNRVLEAATRRFNPSISKIEDVYVVSANAPLIIEESLNALESLSGRENPAIGPVRTREQICAAILARVLYFFGDGTDSSGLVMFGTLETAMVAAVGALGAEQQMKLSGDSWRALEFKIIDDHVAIDEKYKTLTREVEETQARVRVTTDSISSLDKALEDARLQLLRQGEEAEGAQNALLEKFGLKQTQSLWENQATKARKSYFRSFAILLALLFGIPVAAVLLHTQIIGFLRDIETAVVSSVHGEGVVAAISAISRLLIITAPLALLVWAIKLIVRFNIRSMLLMDDAEQRVTMLNTYLFLVERNAATIQDRGALLEAMFRRAPGHGPESIDPPNITDIMKYGEVMGQKP